MRDNDKRPEDGRGIRRRNRKRALACCVTLLCFGAAGAGLAAANRHVERVTQCQTDPRVATVWKVGITRGSSHVLRRGAVWAQWLESHGVHWFGEAERCASQYHGDPGSIEIWFDYASLLPGSPPLECHRAGLTAFMDDLGQPYQGYLDLNGRNVGVYLPGYDRSAHKLICAVQWMPRRPAKRGIASRTMVFSVPLPTLKRVLPTADIIRRGSVGATRAGVSVLLSDVQLSAPDLSIYRTSQREMTFRVRITGGSLADSNAGLPLNPVAPASSRVRIEDPYGCSLLADSARLAPGGILERQDGETVLRAPVDGAGVGTDAVRIHLDVRPAGSDRSIPFDVVTRVQRGVEI